MLFSFLIIYMFFSGLYVFCFFHKHLLICLFSLEYLVLVLFLFFMLFLFSYGYEVYFSILFLVFSVCEGSLGLGILVNLIRSHGNDYLSSVSIMSW